MQPIATTAAATSAPSRTPTACAGTSTATPLHSIGLVVLCTLVGAAAQIFIRFGADRIDASIFGYGLIGNWALLGGLVCLGLNTLLLVVALREGQLSVLYPIIALTYVWVTILSPMFFTDVINAGKALGVGLIVLGVSLIGWGSRS